MLLFSQFNLRLINNHFFLLCGAYCSLLKHITILSSLLYEFINGRNYCFTFPKDVIKTEDCLEVRKKISMLLLSSRLNRREV